DGIRDFHVTGVQTCALPICCKSHGAGCYSPRPVVRQLGWSGELRSTPRLTKRRRRQMRGKRWWALLAALTLLLAACGGGSSEETSAPETTAAPSGTEEDTSTETTAAPAEGEDEGAEAERGEGPHFIYITPNPIGENEFLQMVHSDTHPAAARLGGSAAPFESADPSSSRANIEAAVQAAPDIIVLTTFQLTDMAVEFASANPDQKFILIDDCPPEGQPENLYC